MAKLESLTRTASKWLAPEGFGTLSGNVLLYAPGAIRVATSIFLVIGVLFSIPYMLDHRGDLRLVLTRVFVVLLAALATLLTFIFAGKYYKILVLATAFSGITVTLFAVTFMDGPNINPHAALLVVYIVGAGFCLGRRGVMITLAWLIVNYALIIAVSDSDIWPHPTSISVAKVQYENASAMFFLLLVLIPLLLGYLALVEKSIGELKGSHAEQQRLLQRLIAVQEGERERIRSGAWLLHLRLLRPMSS